MTVTQSLLDRAIRERREAIEERDRLRGAAINLRNQALPPSMGHEWYCVRPKDFDALRAALEPQP